MGLKQSNNIIFLAFGNGMFKLPVDEGTEGAKKHVTKDGRTIWYCLYDTLSGYLDDVTIKYNEKYDADLLVVRVRDDEDHDKYYQFGVRFNSYTARGIIAQLLSADIAQPVTFKSWEENLDDGTTRSRIIVLQNGKALNWYLISSRNEKAASLPKERILPPPEKKVVSGKTVWDFTDQLDMLREYVEKLRERIKGANMKQEHVDDLVDDLADQPASDENNADIDDDLPF